MAAAIDRFTVVLGRPVPGGLACQVEAVNFAQSNAFDLAHLESSESGAWPDYVKGVAWAIEEAAAAPLVSGFDLAIAGDVPLGAGLSSSASLQASLAFFLFQAGLVSGRSINPDLTRPARSGSNGARPVFATFRECFRGRGFGPTRPVLEPFWSGTSRPLP